jgi:hypothetical protein
MLTRASAQSHVCQPKSRCDNPSAPAFERAGADVLFARPGLADLQAVQDGLHVGEQAVSISWLESKASRFSVAETCRGGSAPNRSGDIVSYRAANDRDFHDRRTRGSRTPGQFGFLESTLDVNGAAELLHLHVCVSEAEPGIR